MFEYLMLGCVFFFFLGVLAVLALDYIDNHFFS